MAALLRVMRALAATLAIATVAGGCAAEQPVTATESIVPTIPLHVLARNIGDFRGRTVRTCGPELEAARRPDGEVAYWIMSARDPISRHNNIYSGVHIASCAARPPVDADGCVTGRVAREDGSLEAPADVIIGSHRIVSFEWILHPQCGPTR